MLRTFLQVIFIFRIFQSIFSLFSWIFYCFLGFTFTVLFFNASRAWTAGGVHNASWRMTAGRRCWLQWTWLKAWSQHYADVICFRWCCCWQLGRGVFMLMHAYARTAGGTICAFISRRRSYNENWTYFRLSNARADRSHQVRKDSLSCL